MRLYDTIKYRSVTILLGVVLCYLYSVASISCKMEIQRIKRLELRLSNSLSLSRERIWRDVLLKEEATIRRIVVVMDRYRTYLSVDQKKELAHLILSESRNYQYDPLLTVAVIMKESGFNPQACSWKGARGLMQIKPATAKEVAGRIGLEWQGVQSLHDPYFNIKSGIYYLAAQRKEFGDLHISLAAYNHGPTAVRRMIALGRRVPQGYAKWVMKEYEKLKKEASEMIL